MSPAEIVGMSPADYLGYIKETAQDMRKRAKTQKTSSACGNCGKEEKKMRTCSACRTVLYCSPQCQKEAWPVHKAACKKAKAAAFQTRLDPRPGMHSFFDKIDAAIISHCRRCSPWATDCGVDSRSMSRTFKKAMKSRSPSSVLLAEDELGFKSNPRCAFIPCRLTASQRARYDWSAAEKWIAELQAEGKDVHHPCVGFTPSTSRTACQEWAQLELGVYKEANTTKNLTRNMMLSWSDYGLGRYYYTIQQFQNAIMYGTLELNILSKKKNTGATTKDPTISFNLPRISESCVVKEKEVEEMSVKQLKAAIRKGGLGNQAVGLTEKRELVELLKNNKK